MEEKARHFAAVMDQIKEKARTAKAVAHRQQQILEEQTKAVAETKSAVDKVVDQTSEAKSKFTQIQTSREDLAQQNKDVRETCCEIARESNVAVATLKNCQEIYRKVAEEVGTTSGCVQQLEKQLRDFENSLDELYERKLDRVLAEIEREELMKEKEALEKVLEQYNEKLRKAAERKAFLERAKSKLIEGKKTIKTKLEEVEKENQEYLQQINLEEQELKKLQEKDDAFLDDMKTLQQEEQKTEASIQTVQGQLNMLKQSHEMLEASNKQLFQRSFRHGFVYNSSHTEQDNLEQCKAFLAEEVGRLKKQNQALAESTKQYEDQMRDLLDKKTQLKMRVEEAEENVTKLKSERLSAELQNTEIKFELDRQTEKQKNELAALKERVDEKSKMLQSLRDEIERLRSEKQNKQSEFCEMHKELDEGLERLAEEKRDLMAQLAESTERMKRLDRECDDLSYNMVKLENKMAQLVRPEKQTAAMQARLMKRARGADETSESSVGAYSPSHFRRNIERLRRKKAGGVGEFK